MCAIAVGVVKLIVVINADRLLREKPTVKHRKNTDRQKKVKQPTGSRKKTEEYEILKKPWMIHLQHPVWLMIMSFQICCQAAVAVIFAEEKGKL